MNALDKILKMELDQYLDQNYVEEGEILLEYVNPEEITKGPGKQFSDGDSISLDDLMNSVGETFHEMLFQKIDTSGMTDVEVYKRAGIDRKLFSKIRSNPMYHPRKQTVLALAIALRLDINETIDLLARAEYAFSPGSKGDLIVRFFVEKRVYDIQAINFALYEYDQPTLG